jgi:hypothetical protein
MSIPPLPSLLIVVGLVLSSVAIVNRAKKSGLLSRPSTLVVMLLSVLLIGAGLILHFRGAPVAGSLTDTRRAVASGGDARSSLWAFSFAPRAVRWGEEVTFRVTPMIERIEVYLNGTPLPCTALGGSAFAVTIPTISKSGYFTISCNGSMVRAKEEVVVSP